MTLLLKRRRIIAVLCIAAMSQIAITQESHLQAGTAYFKQGEYTQALAEFSRADIEHPHNAQIENLLGITETQLGDIEAADQHYREAIQDEPALLAPHKNLAVNYLTAARYKDAEDQLQIALKLNSSDPFLHYYLASLYVATSRDRQAIKEYDPAASLIAKDPVLLYGIAMACLREGMKLKALSLVSAAEQQSLFDVSQEYQLALLLTKLGMYSDASERFRQIVHVQPESWSARFDLAISLLNAGEQHGALPLLERLVQERPADANIQALLGSTYELTGDDQKALKAYQAAVAADPNNPDRYLDYTRLLMDLDRYEEAASIIQSGIGNVSEDYALVVRKGSIQLSLGQYAQARSTFQQAIAIHPEINLAYYAVAQSFMREGHDQEAADVLAIAETKTPPDARIDYLRGLALSQMGKHDEAVLELNKSIALDDRIPEPHYELGKLLIDDGKLEAAKQEFERVIVLAPDRSNAYYQLSKLYGKLGDKEKAEQMAKRTQELLTKQHTSVMEQQQTKLRAFREVQPQ